MWEIHGRAGKRPESDRSRAPGPVTEGEWVIRFVVRAVRPIGLGPNHTHSPLRIAACLALRARRSPTSPGWRVWS